MIYNLAILIYDLLAHLAALFGMKKARLLVRGHRAVFPLLEEKIDASSRYIWFHAASLGEFEQGRPLMESIRALHPEYKILLTFFSPSGYEVRKNYPGADIICYLPFDRPANVRRFLRLVRPAKAFFIKYEFWKNYLDELHRHGVPTYSVSSIFRPNQVFFKKYSRNYSRVLTNFDRLFVQNETSQRLLASIGVDRVTIVGDTRFDRVLQIYEQRKSLPLVEAFKGEHIALVAGSSWPPDEDLFIAYFNAHPELKLIIAPHVIDEAHLQEIIAKLRRPHVRYTQATEASARRADCLIIDCYGLLSSIYRYGELAYIGGGFGVGIHNTLEAAVYAIPVIFGPNHTRFREAMGLLDVHGAFSVTDYDDFSAIADRLLTDSDFRHAAGESAGRYVSTHAGATQKVLELTME